MKNKWLRRNPKSLLNLPLSLRLRIQSGEDQQIDQQILFPPYWWKCARCKMTTASAQRTVQARNHWIYGGTKISAHMWKRKNKNLQLNFFFYFCFFFFETGTEWNLFRNFWKKKYNLYMIIGWQLVTSACFDNDCGCSNQNNNNKEHEIRKLTCII